MSIVSKALSKETYDKNDSASFHKITLKTFFDNVGSSVHIQRSEHVIQQDSLRGGIYGPRKRNSGLLTTTECDALLSDFGGITSIEECDVRFQSTLVQDLAIPFFVVSRGEENVVLVVVD